MNRIDNVENKNTKYLWILFYYISCFCFKTTLVNTKYYILLITYKWINEKIMIKYYNCIYTLYKVWIETSNNQQKISHFWKQIYF